MYGLCPEVPNVCARLSSLHILRRLHTFPCFFFLVVTDTGSKDRCSAVQLEFGRVSLC